MEPVNLNDNSFWQSKSIVDLAREQQVQSASIEDLAGRGRDLWDSDEELDQFLAEIHDRRHELSPA